MSTPPPSKRLRTGSSGTSSPPFKTVASSSASTAAEDKKGFNLVPPPLPTSSNSRKRPASPGIHSSSTIDTRPPPLTSPSATNTSVVSIPSLIHEDSGKKRSRTNTPWTAAEEQRLKQMRDAGNTWNEIAKAFPNRTEGSVKKHWYKDMHYAEFAEEETKALLEAIKEYEANKWKVIGQKLNKPAKACEQFAKDHFKNV